MTPINVAGIYLGHDAGCCVVQNGAIRVAIEEERLTRYKHGRPNRLAGLWEEFNGRFGYFPWASLTYCLRGASLTLGELDRIVVGDPIWAAGAADTLQDFLPVVDPTVIDFPSTPEGGMHHFHHALSTFWASGFKEAAVLVVDGDGNTDAAGYEAETGYVFKRDGSEPRLVFKNRYRHDDLPRRGLGWMYEQVSLLLGFGAPHLFVAAPGKTMGLAAYGRPRRELEAPWIEAAGAELDFGGFRTWMKEHGYESLILDYSRGIPVGRCATDRQYAADLALKAQKEIEEGILALVRELSERTGLPSLCVAGGVGLNSVANGRVIREGPFRDVFIQPASHDGGQAIGLAYRGYLAETARRSAGGTKPPLAPWKHAFWGRHYSKPEILDALDRAGVPWERMANEDELVSDAAQALDEGAVVGWFQGGSEYGPRALGHRSILADPRPADMRDRVNGGVKFREDFRPFAPSVLAEHAAAVFEVAVSSPYMLMVAEVREGWRARVPSITHVDHTARLHTVDAEVDGRYHRLISAFHELTGVPLILNTSFNVRGEPIVESPLDALRCAALTALDALYLHDFKIPAIEPSQIVPEWRTDALVELREQPGAGGMAVVQGWVRRSPVRCSVVPEHGRVLLAEVDGRRDVARCAAQARCDERELLGTVQALIRAGPMKARLGAVHLGVEDHTRHWWMSQPAFEGGTARPHW